MSDTPEQAVQESPGASVAPGDGSVSEQGAEPAAVPGAPEGDGPSEGYGAPEGDGASGGYGAPEGDGASGGYGAPAPAPGEVAERAPEDGDVAEIEEDLDELVKVGAQRDEYLALAQRTQADFENYRKRVVRESALAQERGVAKLAKELLPALDNLDRALEAAAVDDPLLQGVRLVREELAAALARVGVESFSPAGEPFDPAFHEAIAQQPVQGVATGTVAEVYQPGYRLGEQIIRPARVVVAA